MRIVLSLAVVCAAVAPAQPYIISTFAGGVPPLPAPVPALTVPVFPGTMATDTAGNVYFLARGSYVLKLDQQGVLSRVAGNGRTGYSGDGGPASSAQLLRAQGIAVDGAGNLFIADSGNNRIRRVSPNGIITTVVGDGTTGTFPIDGVPATSAPIRGPNSVAVDSAGNLFIAEEVYGLIRKVSPDGIITTVSGCRISCSPGSGFGGPAISSSQGGGGIVVADGFGNLFVARAYSINKVSPDGVITAFAGGTNPFDCATCLGDNGPATKAAFAPYGLVVDNAGDLFVADGAYRRIRKISPDGIITTVAGSGGLTGALNAPQFAGDGGPATAALLGYPGGVAVDGTGNLFIADAGNGRIRKVTSDGIINTVAGKDDSQACFFGDGGSALNAGLCGPYDVAVDKSGNVFIADLGSYRVRKVSSDGVINTVAGNGVGCFGCPLTGDGGLATNASIVADRLAVDSAGNLFIAGSFSVRKVSPDGIITTVAGNGTQVHSGDGGPAKQAGIRGAVGVAVGPKGQLFISEGLYDVGTQIREVLPDGTITTVAGTGTAGYAGNYSGNGGPAVSAQLAPPSEDCFYDDGDGLAVDTAGDLFIADSGNNRIRQVTPDGTINTVAGNGSCNYNPTCTTQIGDGGPATQAGLAYPVSEALDTAGNMYIVEGSRVRKVTPDGIITTIAGSDYSGYSGYSGDGGLATDAALSSGVWGPIGPQGVAVDSAGNVYVADTGNNAVRILRPAKSSVVITAVVNAASQKAGPVSPDEIVTIYGAGLGPPQLTTDPNAGTRVFFNGVPAQIIYTSAKQIGAIVPESIAAMAQVTVSYRGQVSDAISVPVGPYSLGLFTLNQTGVGQAAATNADGTVNTAANPAKIGSSISLYANSRDDPNVPVSVTIGGILSTVQYWDSTGNVERVKVQIPNSVQPGGYVPVVLKVGDASTTDSAVWIAVSGN